MHGIARPLPRCLVQPLLQLDRPHPLAKVDLGDDTASLTGWGLVACRIEGEAKVALDPEALALAVVVHVGS